ncbi:MAG: hypothetical protein K8F52_09500 [Candidatus Scalindua rubra]|nr:hypothetical protein [Candidatus Scalindua rubra]
MQTNSSLISEAANIFEKRYDCDLSIVLSGFTKRERRNLLRRGRLSTRIINTCSGKNNEEYLNISYEIGRILLNITQNNRSKNKRRGRLELFTTIAQ